MQPAELSYNFLIPDGNQTKYIDLAQVASAVNRRLYEQGKCYYVSRVSCVSYATPGASGGGIGLSTLPDTWVTVNAHVKAKALWNTMNKGVLKDNPSVKGKWADFKVFFDVDHYNGGFTSAGPTLNLFPSATSGGGEIKPGEWYMSTYVSPQHDVNAATGVELPADEYKAHMLGADVGAAGSRGSAGIVAGYEETRARVQIAPDVPTDMQTNWMTELSDLGGQDPELANVIEDANDNPPYDLDEYPGGASNFNTGVLQSSMIVTTSILSDKDIGFKVPLGLIKVTSSTSGDGSGNGFLLTIHLTPGHYKGLMATEVKQ